MLISFSPFARRFVIKMEEINLREIHRELKELSDNLAIKKKHFLGNDVHDLEKRNYLLF